MTSATTHFGQDDQGLEQKDKKGEVLLLSLVLMLNAMHHDGGRGVNWRDVKEREDVNGKDS